jgi:hypothetical protein
MESKKVFLILLSILFLAFLIYFNTFNAFMKESPIFTASSHNNYYFFSEQYSETGALTHDLGIDDLPDSLQLAFTPRDFSQINGVLVPKGFLGIPIIFGGLYACGILPKILVPLSGVLFIKFFTY